MFSTQLCLCFICLVTIRAASACVFSSRSQPPSTNREVKAPDTKQGNNWNNYPPLPPQRNFPTQPTPLFSRCGQSITYHAPNGHPAGQNIVGGREARQMELPFQVYIEANTWICGGVVLNEWWVMTAGHCCSDPDTNVIYDPRKFMMILGAHYVRQVGENQQYRRVQRVVRHPQYTVMTSQSSDFDFCMLKIEQVANLSKWAVQPICLPRWPGDGCQMGTQAYISGWGSMHYDDGHAAPSLRMAWVPIVSRPLCAEIYGSPNITDRMICAGFPNGNVADTCQGDSGGPLAVFENGFYKLCGITSWGEGCAQAGYVGVYAAVGQVLNWVQTVMST